MFNPLIPKRIVSYLYTYLSLNYGFNKILYVFKLKFDVHNSAVNRLRRKLL